VSFAIQPSTVKVIATDMKSGATASSRGPSGSHLSGCGSWVCPTATRPCWFGVSLHC